MNGRVKVILSGTAVAFAIVLAGAFALASIDVRSIGRSSPKQAAHYRLPGFNFSETYVDGAVLGVVVGSTRTEAIQAAERAGLTVAPGGWGDNRAGGASLYDRSTLLAKMLRQPRLDFNDEADTRRGMIIRFRGDHVASISAYYINSEGT